MGENSLDSLFGKFLPKTRPLENSSKPSFVIGVDTYDARVLTYCLMRSDGVVILTKKMSVRIAFEDEVSNLAKYFDAIIIRE